MVATATSEVASELFRWADTGLLLGDFDETPVPFWHGRPRGVQPVRFPEDAELARSHRCWHSRSRRPRSRRCRHRRRCQGPERSDSGRSPFPCWLCGCGYLRNRGRGSGHPRLAAETFELGASPTLLSPARASELFPWAGTGVWAPTPSTPTQAEFGTLCDGALPKSAVVVLRSAARKRRLARPSRMRKAFSAMSQSSSIASRDAHSSFTLPAGPSPPDAEPAVSGWASGRRRGALAG